MKRRYVQLHNMTVTDPSTHFLELRTSFGFILLGFLQDVYSISASVLPTNIQSLLVRTTA